MTIDKIINKLSDTISECYAFPIEKEVMLQLLADLIVAMIKRDANE